MGGENSKLAFRKCVFRLADQRGLPDGAEDAWSPFWLMPDSAHDVFSLVTPADIRRIRDGAQENFIKLADKVFDRLLVLKAARDPRTGPADTKQLLNCIRVLTRLVPFVYEARPDGSTIEDIMLWTARPRPGSGADYTLGNQLVAATIDLLFTSGFAVPPATVGEEAAVRYTIWENGIGQTSSLGSSKEHIAHRVEVLRLLLVLCCKTMYIPPARSVAIPNQALQTVAYNANKKMVLCLLCSLINTSLKFRTQGWAIPYRNSTALDPSDELSLLAMQALFAMLEYQAPATATGSSSTSSEPEESAAQRTPSAVLVTETETGAQNLFRVFVAKLHRQQEFDYLSSSIIRLLEETMQSNLSILASVTKQPTRHVMPQEATIMLWLLLENNRLFREYVVDHNRSLRLFAILLYFMLDGYGDPAQAGMVRTISHILHYLSEDHRFATRLMQPFDQSILPSTMRIVDTALTHADFMVNTAFTLLRASKPHLVPVSSNLLLLVRNVSPYLTQISQATADKLVALLDIISSPAFIISEPHHVRWLIYLIEVFDYVVHYRAADNPHLMYSMVQARACFERLKAFDLDKAKSDLATVRAKKGKADAARTIGSPPSRVSEGDHGPAASAGASGTASPAHGHTPPGDGHASPALSDKARGKQPEPTSPIAPGSQAETRHATAPPAAATPKPAGGAGGQQPFQPSPEWVLSWLPDLPLDPIINVLNALAVRIDQVVEGEQLSAQTATTQLDDVPKPDAKSGADGSADPAVAGASDEPRPGADPKAAAIRWLSSDDMARALPDLEESMPEIRPRLQGLSPALVVWFRSLLWSLIYASGMKPYGVWKNTHVRLFVVKSAR